MLAGAINPIIHWVTSIVHGIERLWRYAEDIWHWVSKKFPWLTHWINNVINFVDKAFAEVYKTFNHITLHVIPNWILDQARKIEHWASGLIDDVWSFAKWAYNKAIDYASRAINSVSSALDKAFNWAKRQIYWLLDKALNVFNGVADLVLHPDKLVRWILPYLWSPLWRFVEGKAPAIGSWILRRSLSATISGAHLLESIIAKLM